MSKSPIARAYSYKPQSYSGVLDRVHKRVTSDMEKGVLASEAFELQTLLSEIKKTAKILEKEPIKPEEEILINQYENLINQILFIENNVRTVSGRKALKATSLFRRRNKTKTINAADNIFEEEMAALTTALDNHFGKYENMVSYLSGGSGANVAAAKDLTPEVEKIFLDTTKEVADKMGTRLEAKKIAVDKSQKIDNKGVTVDIEVSFKYDEDKLKRLAYYMKDATFTDKQYSRWSKNGINDYSRVQLHLGNTSLYKAITGVVSEVYKPTEVQRSIFYRGLQILKGTKKNPSATPEEVTTHFTHMRFAFELRGTGLIDANGRTAIAKYIIYNDPNSDTIYVRDTASLILEEMQKNRSNLFGNITLAASRVKSRKN